MKSWLLILLLLALGAVSRPGLADPAAGPHPAFGEPDWVFHVWQPYWSLGSIEYWPDIDAPWGKVAWGEFWFELQMGNGFEAKIIACSLTYGDSAWDLVTSTTGECEDLPGCFDLFIGYDGVIHVEAPQSAAAFSLSLSCPDLPIACGFVPCGYEGWGYVQGTVYLYATPVAVTPLSWSAVKSRY